MNPAKTKPVKRAYTVHSETLESVTGQWPKSGDDLAWNCLFVLPAWLNAWWHNFGHGAEPYLLSIRQGTRTIGIAPLQAHDHTVRLIGDEAVCDHLDFIVAPEKTSEFYRTLIQHLQQEGIRRLELGLIRPDSSAYAELLPQAEKMGCNITTVSAGKSFELRLPNSWNAYLAALSGKERHEIRRKLRRLEGAGRVRYRVVDNMFSVQNEIETFLTLFHSNRPDKAAFMSDQMLRFFRELAEAMAAAHILKLFFLDLDGQPVAAVMCFDYQSTRYLYNNGYNSHFSRLSVGLASKVFSIKDSIQTGQKTYDFLNGAEAYKQRLGGRPVPLYRCLIELT